MPDNLQPGFYVLLASANESFSEQDNLVMANEFWVSPLAVVLRTGGRAAEAEGFVLDADTGEPLKDAQVRVWTRKRVGRENKWTEGKAVRADENGKFTLQGTANESYVVLAKHGDKLLATGGERYSYRQYEDPQPYEQTVFFTDRSLYRPGQTVQYKGIAISVNPQRDNYQTLANKPVTVVFEDANGQEIAKQEHRTNDYGSFSGSFTAPRDRLTGQMRIRDASRDNSIVFVSVEEYKRPKFKVELDSPTEPAKLNGDVAVGGTAKAYTGAAIGGAQVQYRVVREVRYPIWWYWRCWWNPPQAESQEITHGTTTTDTDGKFSVPFVARPAPDVSEKDEPIFHFTVYADVTDVTGETRSDQRSVNVGFAAMQASLAADDWQAADKDVSLTINTQSLDGEPQAAKGQLKVYRLQQPDKVHRPPLQSHLQSEYAPMGVRGTRRGAESNAEPDLSNMNAWSLGELVVDQPFTTDASGKVTATCKLAAGPYRALLETADAFGKPVTAIQPITVLDPQATRLEVKTAQILEAPKWGLEPGETFTALWGTGYETGRAFIEVEHRGKFIQSYWTRPNVTQATLEQAITEEMRGGFTVYVTFVRENRAYFESRRVDVPWTNKRLTLKWEHFVSKLQPGAEESWSLQITGPQAEKVATEMVAGLYDASLGRIPAAFAGRCCNRSAPITSCAVRVLKTSRCS